LAHASDGIQHRPITIGLETPDRVEVRTGLRADDLVVIGSRTQLKPGAPVTAKVMTPPAAEGAR